MENRPGRPVFGRRAWMWGGLLACVSAAGVVGWMLWTGPAWSGPRPPSPASPGVASGRPASATEALADFVDDWEDRRATEVVPQADGEAVARLAADSMWTVRELQELSQRLQDGQGHGRNLGPLYRVILDRARHQLSDIAPDNPRRYQRADDTMRTLKWAFRPLWEDIKDPALTQDLFLLQSQWSLDEAERLWAWFMYGDFFMVREPPDLERALEVVLGAHQTATSRPEVFARLTVAQQAEMNGMAGYLLRFSRRFEEALPYLRKATDQPEGYHARPASRHLIECHLALSQFAEAEQAIRQRRQRFPADSWNETLEEKLADAVYESEMYLSQDGTGG